MRQHTLAGVLLALLVPILVACGSTAAPTVAASPGTQSCSGVRGAHHAWLVVQHLSGSVVRRCEGFDSTKIGAEQALKSSGIEYQAQSFGSLGVAVCQVDNEPAQFSQCLPANAPYWSLWVARAGGAWSMPDTGISGVELGDHDALGLKYTQPTEPSPAPPPAPPGG